MKIIQIINNNVVLSEDIKKNMTITQLCEKADIAYDTIKQNIRELL